MTFGELFCLQCGSDDVETTLIGALRDDRDPNTVSCRVPGCGWRGLAREVRRQGREVEEAWHRWPGRFDGDGSTFPGFAAGFIAAAGRPLRLEEPEHEVSGDDLRRAGFRTDELRPCPFCECRHPLSTGERNRQTRHFIAKVFCPECHASVFACDREGMEDAARAAAVEKWNRRSGT